MNEIIEKYYLKPGSKLAKQQIGTNGVNCWFDVADVDGKVSRQHRCIFFADFIRAFTTLKTPEQV